MNIGALVSFGQNTCFQCKLLVSFLWGERSKTAQRGSRTQLSNSQLITGSCKEGDAHSLRANHAAILKAPEVAKIFTRSLYHADKGRMDS